ncbi:MAG: hypothetical protein ACRDN9_16035 [Streptosporangiaceae bacterium]
MSVGADYSLSDLVRKPSEVVADAERRDVIIHRRGKADLRLALASRDESMAEASDELTRLVAEIVGDRQGRAVLGAHMPAVYPWLRLLPESEMERCVGELLDTARACASVRNFSAYETTVAAWRHTAEIYSDPELYALLSGPVEIEADLGEVHPPDVR